MSETSEPVTVATGLPIDSLASEVAKPPRFRRWGKAVLVGLRDGWPTLVFDVLGPIAVFQVLVAAGCGQVPALVWSAFPPLVIVLIEFVRDRKVNGVGLVVLVSIALALVFALVNGSPEQIVARDAYGNAALGVAMLVTLAVGRRPLLYYLLRLPGEDFVPGLRESFAEMWDGAEYFRHFLRTMSWVFGIVLIVEAACRFVFAYTLPIGLTLAIFQLEGFVLWGLLLLLVIAGYRRVKVRWESETSDAGDDRDRSVEQR